MKSSGVDVHSDWLIKHEPSSTSEEAGYKQAKVLIERHPEATAIFANNDSMAWGAITGLRRDGLQCPLRYIGGWL